VKRDRNIAWIITWLAYATYYTGRKGLSVAKKSIRDRVGVSEDSLGAIDTGYLAAYSIGQFVSGLVGDRVGARRLIAGGMLLSAAMCIAFGSVSGALAFGVIFCVNGFAQSTGWPGTTRAMAEWTTLENRGTVMAFWATCYQVGGIVATGLAGFLLGRYGWRWAFFGPAIVMAVVAIAVFALLKPGPSKQHAAEPEKQKDEAPESEAERTAQKSAQRAVLKNPVLWCYGASYFSIKFIRYALLFWLPYFLATRRGYGEEQAAYVSTAFEAGGIVGVIVLGVASDRLRHFSRSLLASITLVGLTLALFVYTRIDATNTVTNVISLALIGATLFGPDALISGAASQDAGGRYAAGTATGFVNGLGSMGSMLEGLAVPRIGKHYGWDSVFLVFVGLALLSAITLVPTFRRAPPPQAET
jgi:sugar phosphate permease